MLTRFRRWLLRMLFPELVRELASLRADVDIFRLGAGASRLLRSLDCGHLDTSYSTDHDGITRCRVCHEIKELSRPSRVA